MSTESSNAAKGTVHRSRPTGQAVRGEAKTSVARSVGRAVRQPSSQPVPPLRLGKTEKK